MSEGAAAPSREWGNLLALLAGNAEDVAEATWHSAAGALDAAAALAREGAHGRFRSHPRGELRRFRRSVAVALNLARVATAMQQDENEYWHELERPERERWEAERKAARRAQTLPAELARLAKQAAGSGSRRPR